MKKSIFGVVALLAGAFAVHAQGTVSFANYAILSTYTYVSLVNGTKLGGPSIHTTGNPTIDTGNGSDWTVALYGNATGTTPLVQLYTASGTPVTATMETDNSSDQLVGTWYSTAIADVPGTTLAGQSATVQIYAWYNDGGTVTSYAAAQAGGWPVGRSFPGTVITGGPNVSGPPSAAASLPNFGNFEIGAVPIPEPSAIRLGLIGTSVFVLARKTRLESHGRV